MKRILVLALSLIMLLSLCATAFASHSTTVSYTGSGSEEYTLEVPGSLVPGGSGTVTVSGTWASNRKVTVSVPTTVTLRNNLDTSEKTLAVTFPGLSKTGSNTQPVSYSATISIAEATGMLFGDWTGVISYTVSMGDA